MGSRLLERFVKVNLFLRGRQAQLQQPSENLLAALKRGFEDLSITNTYIGTVFQQDVDYLRMAMTSCSVKWEHSTSVMGGCIHVCTA